MPVRENTTRHSIYWGLVMLSYHELKKFIYIGLTALGVLFLVFSWHCFNVARAGSGDFSEGLTALILLVVGSGCLLFGIETYLLQDDPDIWR